MKYMQINHQIPHIIRFSRSKQDFSFFRVANRQMDGVAITGMEEHLELDAGAGDCKEATKESDKN